MSSWQVVQEKSLKWKGADDFGNPCLAAWQSAHGTARCPPSRAYFVFWCLASVKVEAAKVFTVWQPSHLLFNGGPANWPLCSSLWQSVHSANLILYFVA